jgi:mono/diheme cytochrome c family protein
VLLAALGLSLLLTLVRAFVAEYRTEWRIWQNRFRVVEAKLSRTLSDDDEHGLRQIWLPDVGRTDRCISCHLGIDDPALEDAALPFKTHSGTWLRTHRPGVMGCTSCHGGQGAATTYRGAAHKPLDDWTEPMRGPELMEAQCGVCHRERAPRGTLWLARGRELIAESNCVACHDLPGFLDGEVRAPRLDAEGGKVSAAWLRVWLREPKAYLPRSRMANFRLKPQEVDGLAAFLVARQSLATLDTGAVRWERANPEHGGALFRAARCVTCHSVEGRGGTVGPELSRVAGKARRDWLFSYIKDPHHYQPTTLMPRFRFSDDEIRDIVAYAEREWRDPELSAESTVSGGLEAAGRRTFVERGCYRCHPMPDIDVTAKIGPKQADLGDRALDMALLAPQGIAPTRANFLFTKVRAPETLARNALMPTFGFNEDDDAALTVALLSFRSMAWPGRMITDSAVAAYEPQGAFGALVRRYRCLSCHSVRGYGGTLSTVAWDRIGSQLQRSHVESYVARPFTVRVGLSARMPRLGLTPEEARLIADHFASVFVDDALDAGAGPDASLAARGQELYDARGCRACHIVDARGGYVGPDLSGAGLRLTPGWMAAWLSDPQRWKPGTIEPNAGLTDDDRRALAAYLVRQRSARAAGAQ